MKRKIIKIDRSKCIGCGLCARACKEGAIAMVDGKAELVREDYCDGLGNCLPVCPTGAISFEEREAAAFDEAAAIKQAAREDEGGPHAGCPVSRIIQRPADAISPQDTADLPSQLGQWPCQIKLAPPNAAFFKGADLLIAADCTAYAFGNFHNRFMKNKVTLMGCPKLDQTDYAEKLTAILTMNDIKSITVVRMEVPCCGGIVRAVADALKESGKIIPWWVITIGIDGKVIEE
jgi:Fe-S-cluster-containing hydrogenase component 2